MRKCVHYGQVTEDDLFPPITRRIMKKNIFKKEIQMLEVTGKALAAGCSACGETPIHLELDDTK